jgi:hypothetical protein
MDYLGHKLIEYNKNMFDSYSYFYKCEVCGVELNFPNLDRIKNSNISKHIMLIKNGRDYKWDNLSCNEFLIKGLLE